MSDAVDYKALASLRWFGYGQWSAPFWFIGMEPGGNDDDANYDAWYQLGGGELIDCRQHHLNSGCKKWHCGDRPPTQSTWRRLIQVFLAFEDKPTELDAVSRFQRDSFGAIDGNIALIELSALHARSLQEKVNRKAHLPERLSLIEKRLSQHPPKFALFYGRDYREHYERIEGVRFGSDGMCWRDDTLCVLAPGPTARYPTACSKPKYWIELGTTMRKRIEHRMIKG